MTRREQLDEQIDRLYERLQRAATPVMFQSLTRQINEKQAERDSLACA